MKKNKLDMKKIYFYVIALWSIFFVTSGFAQCTFSELAKDFSRNTALKDFVKTDAKAFDAWYLLNKEKPSLRNSLPEVKIVAENFQEVKNAGGYQKWIDKLSTEEKNVPILFLDSQQKFEQTVDVSNLPKHLRSLAYQYYKKANNENKLHLWQRLEEIFKEYKINGNWPPYNGGYNIESGISLQKFQKYDRYANPIGSWDGINEPLLGGNFTSPIIDNKPFDFSSRALNIPESNYTFYYEIEILEDLGFDGELADVIPWFNQKGQGKQVKWNIPKDPTTGRPKTWNKLAEEGKVRITIKDIPNGNPDLIKKWKGYVIGKKVNNAGSLAESLAKAEFKSLSQAVDNLGSLKPKFLEDFANASDDVLKVFNDDDRLLRLWKTYSDEFRGAKYVTEEGAFKTCQSVLDNHPNGYLNNLVKKVMEARVPSNKEQVLVGVTHPEFNGEVFMGRNFLNSESALEAKFINETVHPLLRDKIKYMDFIRNSVTDNTGKVINEALANKLLSIDNLNKLTTAGRAGYHGEIRALSDALYKLEGIRPVNSSTLSEFDLFIRNSSDKVMQRCPCCFHITQGVKVLGGK
ncbi:hypothetical protein BWK62_14605 [Flavobacterium oreochromis]|uniref:Uncharacterized protein n=2 Tax=Flavobacterium TaxID=237 RepID=A0A246G7B2_9FLAO|nr:hypothetical protein BWK62_14605 [Flavobacterium oreochromis]